MNGISDKIIDILEQNGNIKKEYRDVYEYALREALILAINWAVSLCIGYFLGGFWYCILFLCAIMPLRSDAGGYHAPGWISCFLMSQAVVAAGVMWIMVDVSHKNEIMAALALVSFFCIFRYAPLEAENKPLDEIEKRAVGRRARILAALELVAGLLCLPINARISCTLLSAPVWCAAGYAGWFLKKKKKQKREIAETSNGEEWA